MEAVLHPGKRRLQSKFVLTKKYHCGLWLRAWAMSGRSLVKKYEMMSCKNESRRYFLGGGTPHIKPAIVINAWYNKHKKLLFRVLAAKKPQHS
jgi:hypothetical protein